MKSRSFIKSIAFVAGFLPFSSLPAFSQLAMDSFKAPTSFDWDYYVLKDDGSSSPGQPWEIVVFDSTSNESKTIVKCKDSGCNNTDMELGGIDPKTGKLVFQDSGGDRLYLYDPKTGAVSSVKDPFTGSDGSLVRPSITGLDEVRIGKNSLITKEKNGKQELYAEDADGSPIPINVTNGSDLQVDGVSVMGKITKNADDIETNRQNIETNRQNINDLGSGVAGATALTAALSSLPVAADDAPFSCGVGTGGYSSRFAMGVGCAARLNERLSFNAGGSHVFGGSSNYGGGTLDTFAARAGFVFKLGTIQKAAGGNNAQLQSQLDEVKEENHSIRMKYVSLEQQNQDLMARLERLEAIALGNQPKLNKVSLK